MVKSSRILFCANDLNSDPFELETELAAAEFFVKNYGGDFRYCERKGGWYFYDTRRWKRDEDGELERRVSACVKAIADSASNLDDLDERKKRTTFAIQLQKRRGIESIVSIGRYQKTVAIGDPESFDANHWLLNVKNGTLDLRTGTLHPHSREDLITRLVEVPYELQAMAPRWRQFLREIFRGDDDVIAFVQRAVGYSLTGSIREHVLPILYGTGSNGKSTFLSMVSKILGDYAAAAAAATFMGRREGSASNDLARLHGSRFVTVNETNEGETLAEGFVKTITGGDPIPARFLFHEYFQFVPTFTVWLSTNHKPQIRGGDEAIWRRIRLIPFEEHFDSNRADRQLTEKLEIELPGILTWAVQGCLAWQCEGLGSAINVTVATEAYRSEMDVFGDFLGAKCDLSDPSGHTTAGELLALIAHGARKLGKSHFPGVGLG